MRYIAVIAAAVVLAPPAAEAKLCDKCRGGMYIMSVGRCVECGGHTGSGAFKLCKACSEKLSQCEHCRAALAAPPERPEPQPQPVRDIKELATRRFGKWTYRTYYTRATTRSRTTVGELTYDGKAITAAKEGDFVWSPWGRLLWHAKAFTRGWHRPHTRPLPKGKEIASPDPATSGRVRTRIADVESNLKDFAVTVRFADGKPQPGPSLALTTRGADRTLPLAGVKQVPIAEPDARGIVARLATEDFFARALDQRDRTMIKVKAIRPPWYALGVKTGRRRSFDLQLRWGPETLRYLDALRDGLQVDAAKAVDRFLAPLAGQRKKWLAAERAQRLNADLKTFRLWLRHTGEADKPFYTLHYTTAPERPATYPALLTMRHLSPDQARGAINALHHSGLLAEAKEATMPTRPGPISGPAYVLTVSNSHEWLYVNLGWGSEMLARLDALRAALPAELQPDMDPLLRRLSELRNRWRKADE